MPSCTNMSFCCNVFCPAAAPVFEAPDIPDQNAGAIDHLCIFPADTGSPGYRISSRFTTFVLGAVAGRHRVPPGSCFPGSGRDRGSFNRDRMLSASSLEASSSRTDSLPSITTTAFSCRNPGKHPAPLGIRSLPWCRSDLPRW